MKGTAMIRYEDRHLIFETPKTVDVKYFGRKVVNLLQQAYYRVVFPLCRPEKREYRYNVSLCAIFKDEADYLKEWIEFHRIVGVDHFYLYDNKSSDNFMDVLQPYLEEGLVSLKEWPKPQSQMEAYQDFMDCYAGETRWVGFIDLDELVVPNSTETIGDFLKDFSARPVVILYWKCFGTSGYITRDKSGLIAEDFVVSWPKCLNLGKYFFNTGYEYDQKYFRNRYMHSMYGRFKGRLLPPVNAFNRVCTYGMDPVPSSDMPIQINHYPIKSYREYTEKKSKRGGGVNPVGVHDYSYFYRHESKCCDTDYHAYRFLIKLKLAMGRDGARENRPEWENGKK